MTKLTNENLEDRVDWSEIKCPKCGAGIQDGLIIWDWMSATEVNVGCHNKVHQNYHISFDIELKPQAELKNVFLPNGNILVFIKVFPTGNYKIENDSEDELVRTKQEDSHKKGITEPSPRGSEWTMEEEYDRRHNERDDKVYSVSKATKEVLKEYNEAFNKYWGEYTH